MQVLQSYLDSKEKEEETIYQEARAAQEGTVVPLKLDITFPEPSIQDTKALVVRNLPVRCPSLPSGSSPK